MKKLKKNSLYLWLVHHGQNKVSNAFMDSTISSSNNDEGDKNVLTAFSVSSTSNVNNSSDQNEWTPHTHDGVTNESPSPNEVTSITYVEPMNEIPYVDELTSDTHEGPMSESLHVQEMPPVTYVEPINKIRDLNEQTEVTNDRTTYETTAPYEFIPVPYYGTTTGETTSLYEFVAVPHYGTASESMAPSELTTETLKGTITETMLEQLSRLDDGAEFTDFHDSFCGKIKNILHLIVSSVSFRIFGILLIFVDMSVILLDLLVIGSKTNMPLEYRSTSLAIALFFLMDVLLRIYVEGRKHYFSDLLNILDAIIIGVTLLVDIIYMFYDSTFLKSIPRWAVLFRPLRVLILIRIFHLAYQKRHLEKLTRRLVSGNKRRYKKDGFDLDLTYVTDRIIAMSFPSSGKQSFYRNPITEVARFLDTKHPDHYRVYNLCSERSYDPKYFHYRVRRFMIDDHNVPTLEEMLSFSQEVVEWMAQDDKNVVAIHCKGGKGRTGTMVCACLIAREVFLNAEESLYYFGERRTDKTSSTKFQGVETPSQSRYVGYFEKVKYFYNWTLPPRKTLKIKRFIIYSIHGVGKGNGSDLKAKIIMQKEIIFSCSSSQNCRIFHDIETDRVIINVFNCPVLYDDVKVQFFSSSDLPKYYDDCPFFFWFHTSFIQNNRLYLPRNELDNPHKSKTWKIYRPDFAVEVCFDET